MYFTTKAAMKAIRDWIDEMTEEYIDHITEEFLANRYYYVKRRVFQYCA